jgi:1,5-anhydro-D-fructose reductase (1,5-anhydro-D-mannitol-forming)
MSDCATLNWGLIGASDIAHTLMIPALRRMNQRILGLASSNADHAADFAVRNEIPSQNGVFDLGGLLANPNVDAVYISSTNEQHLAHAEAAAAAGKHVLCEKPLSVDLDSARQIVAACAAHGIVLGVNHHLPAAGTHRAVRELVRNGAIGRVLSVNVRHTSLLPERLRGWRLGDGSGAGVVMDLSCHDASVVNPLLGTRALETVAITVRQGRWDTAAEDASAAVIRYEDDVLVRFHDAFTTPHTPTYLEVHGEEGSIVAPEVMTPEPIGTVLLRTARGEIEVDVPDRRHTYDITIEHFARAVVGDGRPVVDGHDAVKALAVCQSILDSARTGTRVPVDFQTAARTR